MDHFTISAFLHVNNKKYYLGSEAILSRWNTSGCANCQTHLEAKAFFDLYTIPETLLTKTQLRTEAAEFSVELHGKDDPKKENAKMFALFSASNEDDRPYHLEIS